MSFNRTRLNKIKKLKDNFKNFKQTEKLNLKEQLQNSDTYKFEKPALKDAYKTQVKQEKKILKEKIINIKKPEFYKKDFAQRNVENQIIKLQETFFNELGKLERNFKRAKRINKTDKSLKAERKQKISDAKKDIQNYKLTQKVILKNEKEKLELNNSVNKLREFGNTSKIVGKRVYGKTMPALSKFANQKHVVSLRNGFITLVPLIMVASFINVILSIPIQMEPQKYLSDIMPVGLVNGMNTISGLTMGLMAIGLAIGIGINLGQQYNESAGITGIMGFLGFVMWLDIDKFSVGTEAPKIVAAIPTQFLGASGIFGALVTSIIMVELYRIFKKYKITIRLPKQVPPAIANSFLAIIPVLFYAVIVMSLRYGANFNFVTGMNTWFSPLGNAINNSLGLVIAINILNSMLWWFGIHGSSITNILTQPAWAIGIAQNQEWWRGGRHGDVPNLYPDMFFQNIIYIGGSGCVIGLVIAAVILAKSKQMKVMSKSTAIPALFNINEPIMFGYPMVFNIYLLIPFIFTPMIAALAGAALCQIFNIVWVTAVPWSLPAFIGAFFASGNDWKAIVVVLIVMGIATLCYVPFFKLYDHALLKEEREKDIKEAEELGITLRELLVQRAKETQEKKLNHKKHVLRNKGELNV